MKKFFAIMLMLVCWTSLCGFKDVTTGAVLSKNGSVTEIISINYEETDATELGYTDFQSFKSKMLEVAQDTVSYLNNCYERTINNLAVSEEVKNFLKLNIEVRGGISENENMLIIRTTYTNKTCWDYLCSDVVDATVNEEKVSLFTKSYYYKMEAKLSKVIVNLIGDKKSFYEAGYDFIKSEINPLNFANINNLFPTTYSYTYGTSSNRIHSNAPVQNKYILYGITEHTWQFDETEDTEIVLYQTVANATAWYILALILTAGVLITLLIIAKYKKPKVDILDKIFEEKP